MNKQPKGSRVNTSRLWLVLLTVTALILCVVLVIGLAFSWITNENNSSVLITAGDVDVQASFYCLRDTNNDGVFNGKDVYNNINRYSMLNYDSVIYYDSASREWSDFCEALGFSAATISEQSIESFDAAIALLTEEQLMAFTYLNITSRSDLVIENLDTEERVTYCIMVTNNSDRQATISLSFSDMLMHYIDSSQILYYQQNGTVSEEAVEQSNPLSYLAKFLLSINTDGAKINGQAVELTPTSAPLYLYGQRESFFELPGVPAGGTAQLNFFLSYDIQSGSWEGYEDYLGIGSLGHTDLWYNCYNAMTSVYDDLDNTTVDSFITAMKEYERENVNLDSVSVNTLSLIIDYISLMATQTGTVVQNHS